MGIFRQVVLIGCLVAFRGILMASILRYILLDEYRNLMRCPNGMLCSLKKDV